MAGISVPDGANPLPHTELRRARRSVAAVFLIHGSVTGNFATRIPWIQDHTAISPGQLGLALAFPAIGASLAMPLAGRISHRFGARTALRGLLALWTLSLVLPALSPGLYALIPALLMYGAASGTSDVAMNALGVETEDRLGKPIMSGLHGMWSAGALLGSAAGTVAAHAGWDARLHLAGAALVLTLLGALACRGVLDLRSTPEEHPPPRFALPPRSALILGAIGFCAVFAEGAGLDWSAVYLRDELGTDAGLAAASTTAFACTMTVARLAGDKVVARRCGAYGAGRRRTGHGRRSADRRGAASGHGDGRVRPDGPRYRGGGPTGLRGRRAQRPRPQPGDCGRRHHHLYLRPHRPVRDRRPDPSDLTAGVVHAGHDAGVRAGGGRTGAEDAEPYGVGERPGRGWGAGEVLSGGW